jgi:adenylate kinase
MENIECEIMQVVEDAARECFPREMIVSLQSHTEEDKQRNVSRICQWIDAWQKNQADSDSDDAEGDDSAESDSE